MASPSASVSVDSDISSSVSESNSKPKGILKQSTSIDHSKKELEWDEMNILATYHPADKDYGFMKVDEPPTPYNRASMSDNEEDPAEERKGSFSGSAQVDPSKLAEKLEKSGEDKSERLFYDDSGSEEDEDETEEEKKVRRAFELKRKMHYNEFQAVQLAKKLMAEEDEEDEGAPSDSAGTSTGAGALSTNM